MATVTLQGNEIHTNGVLPGKEEQAPDFPLVNGDLPDVSQATARLFDYALASKSPIGHPCGMQ